ncbi:MAG: acetyltransferase [Bacteroidaceae bacterium]|nr:acetyltransferase [Bacteroidaceae bacterium]
MKNLIIIGAGGMGRTVYSNALESVGFGEDFVVKGFIDDNLEALKDYPNYPPVIDTIKDYVPQKDDVFVSSIGGASRRRCMEKIIRRDGEFIDLIHKTARIYTNAKLGKGNFIGAFSVIGNDAEIGDYNMIQSYTVIGHDVKIGNWNRIDTHVTLVGGIVIEDDINIHTGAVISHNVRVESGAHVGACSFVFRTVKAGTTVMGNPAKKIM